MAAEGYAAVTTRQVASKVGLTVALVHYYFPSTEDLLVETYRRAVTRHEENIQNALDTKYPLHALWKLLTDSSHIAVGLEFAALANHRKNIRNEIAKRDEHKRRSQVRKLSPPIATDGGDALKCSPICAVMLMEGMARAFAMDRNFRLIYAHAEARKFIERMIDSMEPVARTAGKRSAVAGKSANQATARKSQRPKRQAT